MPAVVIKTERPFSLREKDRMREYKFRKLSLFYPLTPTPTLSLGERELVGQQQVKFD
jgi:hypothetical protein